jgi:hypothetical protein
LVDTGAYTPQTSVHQYLSDIPTSARIAGPITLTARLLQVVQQMQRM